MKILVEERRGLRSIKDAIDNCPFSIAIADAWLPDLPLVYVNRRFEELTGYSASEAIGRNCRFLQGPDTNQNAVAEIAHAISAQKPVMTNLLNYRKDGTSFWNRFQLSPMFGKDGSLDGFMGIQVDMTLDAVETARQTERLRLEVLGQMAGSVAHDIGNVLQPIRLMTEELEELCRHLPEEQRQKSDQCISILLEHASIGASITKQILGYSGSEKAPVTSEYAITVFGAAIRFASRLLPGKVALASEISECFDKEIRIRLDAAALSQALMNLFDNAAKASDGMGDILVSLHEETPCPKLGSEHAIRIDVSDTGRGIPREHLGRVFDPFFTTRSAGQGSGLGLFSVQRLAADWGGIATIRSMEGEGTTVSLYIPVNSGEIEDG